MKTKINAFKKLTSLSTTISDATLSAINSLLDVTGYVYGVINLKTPAVNLESQFKKDQDNYDQFRTNFSIYQGQAGVWIQPNAGSKIDIVSQITTIGVLLTGISSKITSDLQTLKALGPKNSADQPILKDLNALVSSSQTQVESLVSEINTFKNNVSQGNALMNEAYQGILQNVDQDLQTEINGLQATIDKMNADIKAAQKKITKETIEEGLAIAAIAVGTLTAVFGFGLAILAAGIAGVILTKEEIKALKETIATDKTIIQKSFEAMSSDSQAKTAVELFQNNVKSSIEAQSSAMEELKSFSSFLDYLLSEVNDTYKDIALLSSNLSSQEWNNDLDDAITAWNEVNTLAEELSKIQIKPQPITDSPQSSN